MRVTLLAGVIGLFGLTACGQSETSTTPSTAQEAQTVEGQVLHVNADQFETMMAEEPGVLVDVRTPGEYAQGHLEGSVLIDYSSSDFASKIGELDKDQTVYVYCRSGGRSGRSAQAMKDMGFTKVVDLSGGIMSWQSSNKAVEK